MKAFCFLLCIFIAIQISVQAPKPPTREITDDEISLPDIITPEMVECFVFVVENANHPEHPELVAWYIAETLMIFHDLVTRHNECANLITNAAQTACRAAVTASAVIELNRVRNTVNDNMEGGAAWFDSLRTEWQYCFHYEV